MPPSREVAERQSNELLPLYHAVPCCGYDSQSWLDWKALMKIHLSPEMAVLLLVFVVAVVGYKVHRWCLL